MAKVIYTNRYKIRPFLAGDFQGIREWVNDKEVTRNLCDSFIFDHYHSEDETKGFLESTFIDDPNNLKLVIADQNTDEYLGQVNVVSSDTIRKTCSFDIVLPRKNWNRGISSEVVPALIRELRKDFETIKIEIMKSNEKAIRLATKVGFAIEKESKDKMELSIH